MRKSSLCLIVALAIPFPSHASSRDQPIETAQREWIESYNRHDAETLAKIEADDFRIVLGTGEVQSKADQLAAIRKPLPAGAAYEIAIETSEVRRYGKAAVVTGIVVERGKFPNKQGVIQPFSQRSRYTDTWILRKGRWQVVSSHLSDLK